MITHGTDFQAVTYRAFRTALTHGAFAELSRTHIFLPPWKKYTKQEHLRFIQPEQIQLDSHSCFLTLVFLLD